jgi:hypothetical protein
MIEEQEQSLPLISSVSLGVSDFMPHVRNQVYISVKLDQMIVRAAKAGVKLPSVFYVVVSFYSASVLLATFSHDSVFFQATITGWRGTAYPAMPLVVGWYPPNPVNGRAAQALSIALPRAALEDAHLHLTFYFIAPKGAAWKVPEPPSSGILLPQLLIRLMIFLFVGILLDSSAEQFDVFEWTKIDQVSLNKDITENIFAFAYLVMYPKPGQFRTDDYYELQVINWL